MINLYAGSGYLGETSMMRLLSIGIDCVSAAIFVIPALAILQCTIYRKWEFKPFCVKLIFAFYAIALFSVVGVPAVVTFQIDFGLNLIPFIDIVNSPFAYMKNTILNIILFIPMGFLYLRSGRITGLSKPCFSWDSRYHWGLNYYRYLHSGLRILMI